MNILYNQWKPHTWTPLSQPNTCTSLSGPSLTYSIISTRYHHFHYNKNTFKHNCNLFSSVLPEIPYTIIAGCEENVNNCTMNVPLSGKLKCLLSGTKPTAKLSFNISFGDKSDITLRDEIFFVISSDYGTNDSYLTTKFQFSSCLATAVITCVPTEDPFQERIGASKVLLMTGKCTIVNLLILHTCLINAFLGT